MSATVTVAAITVRKLACDCGQVLAVEWERGAFNIVGTTRFRVDERGRVVLVCPNCERRTRVQKQAA